MKTIRFKKARDFVNNICNVKKIWISASDPLNMLLRVIDENLKDAFEITASDFRETADELTAEEQNALTEGRYWELNGVEMSEHQKYLLSIEHVQGMANYLKKRFTVELEKSLLRLKGKVENIPARALPCYDVDPEKGALYFDENAEKIERLREGMNRMVVPIFELNQLIQKECESVWDMRVDDFVGFNIVEREDELYEKIIKRVGEKVKIIIPVMNADPTSSLIVLPCMDWVNKKAGFSVFENIGIGIYENDSW